MAEQKVEVKSVPKENIFKSRFELILIFIGIIFIAANLRAPITSVGPVITEIKNDFKLTHVLVALITAIPLISFAMLSNFIPSFARNIGLEKLLLYSLLALFVGCLIRSSGNILLLFAGAALIGAAITIGNVLMPAFIKKEFPKNVGLVTGFYLVSMNFTSALAAGFSIKIGQITGYGWQGSIGIWSVLALLTLCIWLPQIKGKSVSNSNVKLLKVSLWKSRLAWQIAIFMGLQSVLFYCLAAWLPTVLQSWGMSNEKSGWMLSYIQMAQLPIMLVGPILAGKMKDQTILVWITFVLLILGLGGIIFGKTNYIVLSVILLGISLGLAFTLATMFFVLRTRQPSEAATLSGMSQSIGYIIAACGPPLFGALYSITTNWYYPLGLLVLAAIILFIAGLSSAKNKFVEAS
jgi:CP family cyanate transporter-like MFS transporter